MVNMPGLVKINFGINIYMQYFHSHKIWLTMNHIFLYLISYKIWSNLQTYLWTDQSKDVVMLKLFTTGTTLYPTPWWSPVFPSPTQILFANIFSKYVIDWSQSCNLALNVIKKFNLPARRWWNITLNADYSCLNLIDISFLSNMKFQYKKFRFWCLLSWKN